MNHKATQKNPPLQPVHKLVAGIMPDDKSTEIFGCRETKKVFGISQGKTFPFSALEPAKRAAVYQKMLNDSAAMADLKDMDAKEALEQFAFCIYGSADYIPDFDAEGNLGPGENFLCGKSCRCLKWSSKTITLDGHPLTRRQVEIITLLATDKADKEIAAELNIAESTLSTHKSQIYERFRVNCRSGLIRKAINQKVVQ